MSSAVPSQNSVLALVGRLSAVLRSLQEFDNQEILPVVKGLLSPTDRDNCFSGTYYRTVANVRTALTFNDPSHFQAISMIARSTIEFAMDIKLLNVVPQSVEKMIAFGDSEKLKTARKIVEFAQKSGTKVGDLATYQQFISANETRIVARRQELWGFPQPPEHWSSMKIKVRAAKLGAPFDELYEIKYRHLSWQTHAGLTGVLGLEPTAFAAICGDAYGIAATCYEEVLGSMITELQLSKADSKIWDKLKLARLLPATDGPKERAQLVTELLA